MKVNLRRMPSIPMVRIEVVVPVHRRQQVDCGINNRIHTLLRKEMELAKKDEK